MKLAIGFFLLFNVVFARDPRCPQDNDLPIPHESDCSKFYKCEPHGNLILFDCDPGTQFDPNSLVMFAKN